MWFTTPRIRDSVLLPYFLYCRRKGGECVRFTQRWGEVLFKVRRYYLSVVHHNIQLDKPLRTRRGIRFLKGNTKKKTVKYTPTWHINLIIYGLFTHLCAFTTHLHTLKWNKGTIKEDHSSANKNVSEWIQVLHSKYIYTEVLTSSAWPLLFGEI